MADTIVGALAAAGCFLTAGFYFAFAATVMPALGHDAPTGVAVMRAVNRWAVRPPFMTLFFGTAVLCGAVLVMGARAGSLPAGGGAAAYLAGVAVTVLGNVRLNSALARAAADDGGAWAAFARPWARLNGLRAVLSLLGGALLLAGSLV
ncbi:anthrone oxygenase family protein [Arthrobacter sp. NPDC092385]|uniref:anthrone oxygenase family protein n=1 Tax=Arthrobacter sp. NPDC092385 TaxID=3363943 RepID=UPI00382616BB